MVRVILNKVEQLERLQYLQAKENERNEDRKGHTNGKLSKKVRIKLGGKHLCHPTRARRWILFFSTEDRDKKEQSPADCSGRHTRAGSVAQKGQ